MKSVNEKQRDFYESKKKNLPTSLWSFFRNGVLNRVRKNIGLEKQIYDLHKIWLGDLKGKNVLDLGCYSGNSLSYYLATESKSYTAIDLSEKGISILANKLKDLPNVKLISGDFLNENFRDEKFDLIYAYGVLHHFKDSEQLIFILKNNLKKSGKIISYDPLQTSFSIKMIRTIYRPFQSDREWEWPFTRKVFYKFNQNFNIVDRRGILGKSKWLFLINIFPFNTTWKENLAKKWHKEDWDLSKISDKKLFKCMHLTMLMEKK